MSPERDTTYGHLFGDSFADTVCWKPLVPGGVNEITRTLPVLKERSLILKATLGQQLTTYFGAFLGMYLIYILTSVASNVGSPIYSNAIYLISSLVALFIIMNFRDIYTPIIFDKKSGYFLRNCKIGESSKRNSLKRSCLLSDIYAIQIVSEECIQPQKNGFSWFESFEINLILNDSSRLNVIDCANYAHVSKSAGKIGDFLRVPIWNASKQKFDK